MKEFLYVVIALIILPFILIAGLIYGVLFVLHLIYKYYYMFFEKFMNWVDKNITKHL